MDIKLHLIKFPKQIVREFQIRLINFVNQKYNLFYWIRDIRDVRKKPSTSELIDWIRALQLGGVPTEKIQAELPFVGVVVKRKLNKMENASSEKCIRKLFLRI